MRAVLIDSIQILLLTTRQLSITPVQVRLSQLAPTALLTLRNGGDRTIRYQLSAFAWQQNPQGEIALSPTEDLVFFPQLFALEAGHRRNVRVGSKRPPSAAERTYRLYLEELPALRAAQPESTQVAVRTRTGIPVFVQPPTATQSGRLQDLAVQQGILTFRVENTGSVHFLPTSIQVRGFDETGSPVFERDLTAWYILSGGHRVVEMKMDEATCRDTAVLEVTLHASTALVLTERLPVRASACGR